MTPYADVLLDTSLRISIVAGVVGLTLILGRVRSSSVRHAAWLAVLCAMPLMPLLRSIAPRVDVPIAVSPGAAAVAGTDAASLSPETPRARTLATIPIAAQPVPEPEAALQVWIPVAWTVYLAGVAILLWRLAAGWIFVRRVLRLSRRVLVQNTAVYESELVSTPVTVGLGRQRVLFPAAWNEWPEEKVRAVLAHELAHVERRDTLTSFLSHLNRCVFWFHPLAWWLERQLAMAAEQACDDAGVLALGGENRKYAEVLLDMAEAVRRRGNRVVCQGVGVDGTGLLGRRIDRILRGAPMSGVSKSQKAFVTLSCVAAICLAAGCREKSIYTVELKPDLRREYRAGATTKPVLVMHANPDVHGMVVALRSLFAGNVSAPGIPPVLRDVWREFSERQYQKVSALPEAERFQYLPALAENAYMYGDRVDYYERRPAEVKRAWELARRYAQDELRLAPRFAHDPNYGNGLYRANMILGMIAVRVDRNKNTATKYLLAASEAPANDNQVHVCTLKLPVLLLKYGGPSERRAVIEYLERYGKRLHRPDLDLLHAAAQIREGYMPIWYQYQSAQLK